MPFLNDLASLLRALASRARRLPPPSARRPEAFHEERSELAHELDRLADLVSGKEGAQRRRYPGERRGRVNRAGQHKNDL